MVCLLETRQSCRGWHRDQGHLFRFFGPPADLRYEQMRTIQKGKAPGDCPEARPHERSCGNEDVREVKMKKVRGLIKNERHEEYFAVLKEKLDEIVEVLGSPHFVNLMDEFKNKAANGD